VSAFREQITVAMVTAQRERDHWARQVEKLSELLEGGEPSPPEPLGTALNSAAVGGDVTVHLAGKPKPSRAPGDRAVRAPGAGQAAILAALEAQPGATAQEIAPALGVRPETVLGTLGKLERAHKVTATNTRPKRWSLAASAPSSPAPAPARTPPAAKSLGLGEPEVGGEVVRRIEAALGESDVALTIHSLARAASCTTGAVVPALRRLRSDGRATELEMGKWRATSESAADLVR